MFTKEYNKLSQTVQEQIAEIKRLSSSMIDDDGLGNVTPKPGVTKEQLQGAIVIASETVDHYSNILQSVRAVKSEEKIHAQEVAGTKNLMLSMEDDGFEFPEWMRKAWRL